MTVEREGRKDNRFKTPLLLDPSIGAFHEMLRDPCEHSYGCWALGSRRRRSSPIKLSATTADQLQRDQTGESFKPILNVRFD